jgi:hypothetical protein
VPQITLDVRRVAGLIGVLQNEAMLRGHRSW